MYEQGLTGDLMKFAAHEASAALVKTYRDWEHFTGGRFDSYGVNERTRITGDDVLATTLLSIRVAANTSNAISPRHVGRLGERETSAGISALLEQVPADRPLHELTEHEFEHHLKRPSPANDLYDTLRQEIGLPRVATHKLLARKRPHLFPIRDNVVEQALLPGVNEWWPRWWTTLSHQRDLVTQLEVLRTDAGAGGLSVLRVADIAVWMWERGADQVPGLRERVGAPLGAGARTR